MPNRRFPNPGQARAAAVLFIEEGRIRYTGHARQRMAERGIRRDHVLWTIRHGQPAADRQHADRYLCWANPGGRGLLRVCFAIDDTTHVVIITVMYE